MPVENKSSTPTPGSSPERSVGRKVSNPSAARKLSDSVDIVTAVFKDLIGSSDSPEQIKQKTTLAFAGIESIRRKLREYCDYFNKANNYLKNYPLSSVGSVQTLEEHKRFIEKNLALINWQDFYEKYKDFREFYDAMVDQEEKLKHYSVAYDAVLDDLTIKLNRLRKSEEIGGVIYNGLLNDCINLPKAFKDFEQTYQQELEQAKHKLASQTNFITNLQVGSGQRNLTDAEIIAARQGNFDYFAFEPAVKINIAEYNGAPSQNGQINANPMTPAVRRQFNRMNYGFVESHFANLDAVEQDKVLLAQVAELQKTAPNKETEGASLLQVFVIPHKEKLNTYEIITVSLGNSVAYIRKAKAGEQPTLTRLNPNLHVSYDVEENKRLSDVRVRSDSAGNLLPALNQESIRNEKLPITGGIGFSAYEDSGLTHTPFISREVIEVKAGEQFTVIGANNGLVEKDSEFGLLQGLDESHINQVLNDNAIDNTNPANALARASLLPQQRRGGSKSNVSVFVQEIPTFKKVGLKPASLPQKATFAAVYEGHGGVAIAAHCQQNDLRIINEKADAVFKEQLKASDAYLEDLIKFDNIVSAPELTTTPSTTGGFVKAEPANIQVTPVLLAGARMERAQANYTDPDLQIVTPLDESLFYSEKEKPAKTRALTNPDYPTSLDQLIAELDVESNKNSVLHTSGSISPASGTASNKQATMSDLDDLLASIQTGVESEEAAEFLAELDVESNKNSVPHTSGSISPASGTVSNKRAAMSDLDDLLAGIQTVADFEEEAEFFDHIKTFSEGLAAETTILNQVMTELNAVDINLNDQSQRVKAVNPNTASIITSAKSEKVGEASIHSSDVDSEGSAEPLDDIAFHVDNDALDLDASVTTSTASAPKDDEAMLKKSKKSPYDFIDSSDKPAAVVEKNKRDEDSALAALLDDLEAYAEPNPVIHSNQSVVDKEPIAPAVLSAIEFADAATLLGKLQRLEAAFDQGQNIDEDLENVLKEKVNLAALRDDMPVRAVFERLYQKTVQIKANTLFELIKEKTLAVNEEDLLEPNKYETNRSIKNYAELFNQITPRINLEIIAASDPVNKLFKIKQWLAVAKYAYDSNNYAGFVAVMASAIGFFADDYAAHNLKEFANHANFGEAAQSKFTSLYRQMTQEEKQVLVNLYQANQDDGTKAKLFAQALKAKSAPLLYLGGVQTTLTFASDDSKNPRMKGLKGEKLRAELAYCSTQGNRCMTAVRAMRAQLTNTTELPIDRKLMLSISQTASASENDQVKNDIRAIDFSAQTLPVLPFANPLAAIKETDFKTDIGNQLQAEFVAFVQRITAKIEEISITAETAETTEAQIASHKALEYLRYEIVVAEQNYKFYVANIAEEQSTQLNLLKNTCEEALDKIAKRVAVSLQRSFDETMAVFDSRLVNLVTPDVELKEPFDFSDYQTVFTNHKNLKNLAADYQAFKKQYHSFNSNKSEDAIVITQRKRFDAFETVMTASERKNQTVLDKVRKHWCSAIATKPVAHRSRLEVEIHRLVADKFTPYYNTAKSAVANYEVHIDAYNAAANQLQHEFEAIANKKSWLNYIWPSYKTKEQRLFLKALPTRLSQLDTQLNRAKEVCRRHTDNRVILHGITAIEELKHEMECSPEEAILFDSVNRMLRKETKEIQDEVVKINQSSSIPNNNLNTMRQWLYKQSMKLSKIAEFAAECEAIKARYKQFQAESSSDAKFLQETMEAFKKLRADTDKFDKFIDRFENDAPFAAKQYDNLEKCFKIIIKEKVALDQYQKEFQYIISSLPNGANDAHQLAKEFNISEEEARVVSQLYQQTRQALDAVEFRIKTLTDYSELLIAMNMETHKVKHAQSASQSINPELAIWKSASIKHDERPSTQELKHSLDADASQEQTELIDLNTNRSHSRFSYHSDKNKASVMPNGYANDKVQMVKYKMAEHYQQKALSADPNKNIIIPAKKNSVVWHVACIYAYAIGYQPVDEKNKEIRLEDLVIKNSQGSYSSIQGVSDQILLARLNMFDPEQGLLKMFSNKYPYDQFTFKKNLDTYARPEAHHALTVH